MTTTGGRDVGHYDDNDPLLDDFDYDIFSYGDVNAAIFARNIAGSADGGRIGSVGARGGIDGLIVAESSIGAVISGAAVTAILIAPDLAAPIENDTAIVSDHPIPATPDSIKADLLTEAALARDQVFADYDTLAAQLIT